MTEAGRLARKRKVRGAHRGSVTRIITQVYESLESGEALNLSRLREQRSLLSKKVDVLSKLDDELLEMVAEDELDTEVEQADIVSEKIGQCILDIERALGPSPTEGTVATGGGSPHLTPPPGGSDSTHDHHGGTSPTPTNAEMEDGDDRSVSHPPTETIDLELSSHPPTPTIEATTLSMPTTSHVKLPKLSIKKFNGDLTKWVTFWDTFDSSINSNPNLSNIDKFNYLNSYLESTAAEAVAGLTLTSANYDEAVATLKRRFGNTQLIVNKHMDALLNLPAVSSHHDLKGLRHLYDSVEAHVRGLRALGVTADSYGGMLTSILMNKLPSEIRLVISRELTEERWDSEKLMKIVDREVDARERSATSRNSNPSTQPRKLAPRVPPTASTFMTSNSGEVCCAFCEQSHQSSSCTTVTDVNARKEALRKSGRCYVCLRKNHVSRACRSTGCCRKCRGRHHTTICPRREDTSASSVATSNPTATSQRDPGQSSGSASTPTHIGYVDSHTPVLLQTAKIQLHRLDNPQDCIEARAIMDSGSQRTYVTRRLRESLQLPTKRTESLCIRTFGSMEGRDVTCESVDVGLVIEDGGTLELTALVVPFICNPLTSQPINYSRSHYEHLLGVELADSANAGDSLEVDLLIGSDFYWSLVTGDVRRGRSGPIAIHSRIGWILSGPVDCQDTSTNLTLAVTHTLKIDTQPIERSLDEQLARFWELESLGVMKDEPSVRDKFEQQISFDGQRYQVSLPWRESAPPIPSNLELCHRRLDSLLRRLRQDPQLLAEYDSVIKDQLSRGIVEEVKGLPSGDHDRVHYLPHHGVVRRDKATSKLRIVYDASAKTSGPSLNDCLYTGPSFGQSIFDILLRFRFHRVALAGDIEKAFLMVSVREEDRDSLRFLWTRNVNAEEPEVIALRFTRVVFGVNSSPFLLNATVDHHIRKYQEIDPLFVERFLSSIYVDDVSLGADDVESTYVLYLKSKTRLAEAGFKLRKFVTNSEELRHMINTNEQATKELDTVTGVKEEDQSYAKGSLGTKSEEAEGRHKILGVQWDFVRDTFTFNIGDVCHYMVDSEPTKRSVVSMSARFFDPLGVVSPVTVQFKIFFQRLCEAGIGWDTPLTGDLLAEWNRLHSSLQGPECLVIPRCYFDGVPSCPNSARLVGFCDASAKAYAAVVYLRIEGETQVCVRFVAAKSRVAPLGGMTIPRLELLSALLLSKLIVNVQAALQSEAVLGEPVCYTDSRVALYWIQGLTQEWKQFVENRVSTIRALVPPQCWGHCPGSQNPADIPSRGMNASELLRNPLWLSGPDWLSANPDLVGEEITIDTEIPDECRPEMKSKKTAHSLIATQNDGIGIGQIMSCENFSSLYRLLQVTAVVLRFLRFLREKVKNPGETATHDGLRDIDRAKLYWLREAQSQLQQDSKFLRWKHQFDLFIDKSQLWRCGGRMSNSDLPCSSQNPILLDKRHPLTPLIVMSAHKRVAHNGTKETLTELRSSYWLVRGRQFVRKVIHKCTICRRMEGRPFQSVPSPPLPEYRVRQSRPFSYTGVDFAGPLYVRPSTATENPKVWLCLYTCCVTRAVHLDLVPDLNALTFLRSFKRFAARRGVPCKVVSDNGKTFKAASKIIKRVLDEPEVRRHFTELSVEWAFNLEKAPWWGGIFERMIKSAKRCLKKSVGRACLTYDELLTLVTEIEAVLNSRPLTYVSMDDLEEPLTPSHLLLGYRVLSLPDPRPCNDPDYSSSSIDLSRRMKHLLQTSEKFWRRWRREYLLELREQHRTRQVTKGLMDAVREGQVVVVYDEGQPRGLWRVGRIEEIIPGSDGRIRSARVRVQSKTGRITVLRRPIQHLYPIEIDFADQQTKETGTEAKDAGSQSGTQSVSEGHQDAPESTLGRRPCRSAAVAARDRIFGCVTD